MKSRRWSAFMGSRSCFLIRWRWVWASGANEAAAAVMVFSES
ncbi:hypothetical protein [Arsenicicoccus dermatophilus]|nr:hypothetical protein [Arsenicicoccus dermatophilus]